ncbi:MAG: class I SAM-dependent methyltransferase [Candidatus Magasanikbacteria bacterium]|nr:class I SAM-dependent methyltransferase [Candidatus Magasanikbacteria bacterium]
MSRLFITQTYHRNLLERYLWKFRHLLSGKLLDVGSGTRRYDHLFVGDMTAIDLLPDAKKKILSGDIERGLPYDDQTFDGILCIEVLEYLRDYRRAIREIHRLLRPGGYAFLTIPCLYPDHGDRVRFTERFFTEELSPLFSKVESHRIGNGWTVIWDVLRLKIMRTKSGWTRWLVFLFILPYLIIIKVCGLEKKTDEFYSGIFVVARK